ncbi:9931_t:CDS:1 [Cetraspora pellucida]|uniref:6239_t:CDS:1 n=2 Tax=Cetraspora pellucida TaxID=1433469 RepID=A0A9N9D168_9GLOM|nr:9931_t:CDS:1 [Cetraspora pellucida]CAG8623156.1 6239_t:CDS:1 [Cetraspora pellucida]
MDNSLPSLQETIALRDSLTTNLVQTSEDQTNTCLVSLVSASITTQPEGTNDNSTNKKQGYLSHGSTFTSHTDFVIAVQEYAIREGFTMRLHKLKRNKAGAVRWREIVCSRNGTSSKKKESGDKPTRNRQSQRCKCPFLVRASLNGRSGLWEIISTKLEHNHDIGNTARSNGTNQGYVKS